MFREFGLRTSTTLGSLLPNGVTQKIRRFANQIQIGNWAQRRQFAAPKAWARTREELWAFAVNELADDDVLYLEFGVFAGAATKWWSQRLKNPKSNLHGFDSFEGLPEHWKPGREKGTFDLSGNIPVIDDPRVKFFKGWFEETLPNYQAPPHRRLFINCDADLYSSTKFVLSSVDKLIVPGTLIYFDDFYEFDHERRAFDEYLDSYGKKFKLLVASIGYRYALFECVN